MPKILTTKEKIANVSLNLFSKKGYDGVSVRDIASNVGIKESSVYNHYANKQDILNYIIDEQSERCEEIVKKIFSPQSGGDDIFKSYIYYKGIADKLFKDFFTDKSTIKFWNLLNMERAKNKKSAEKISRIFFDDILGYIVEIFYGLINKGILKKQSPAVLALEFYAPLYIVFQRYYSTPIESMEEVEPLTNNMIAEHISAFCKNNLM